MGRACRGVIAVAKLGKGDLNRWCVVQIPFLCCPKQSEPPVFSKNIMPGYGICVFQSYSTKFDREQDYDVLLATPNTGWRIFTFHVLLEWISMGGGGMGSGSKPRFLFSSSISETLTCSKLTGNERFRKS